MGSLPSDAVLSRPSAVLHNLPSAAVHSRRLLVLITLALALSHPALAQSKYLSDNSSALAAFGGYVAQADLGMGSGGFGISLAGRFDIALSYGKGTLEEDRGFGNVVSSTISSITPSVTYYVAKATPEQPVNVGLSLGHTWGKARELREGGGHYDRVEESRAFLVGGDVSAVFHLPPNASVQPGLSFAYGIVPQDGQAVNHVTSPTIAASLGLRVEMSPSMFFVLEPGLVYATQGELGLAPAMTGGLVIKPFQRGQ